MQLESHFKFLSMIFIKFTDFLKCKPTVYDEILSCHGFRQCKCSNLSSNVLLDVSDLLVL